MNIAKQARREQDRAAMLLSYRKMCRVLRVPKAQRITSAQFTTMENGQVMRACKDLYASATIKQARKIAILAGKMPTRWQAFKAFMNLRWLDVYWWFDDVKRKMRLALGRRKAVKELARLKNGSLVEMEVKHGASD